MKSELNRYSILVADDDEGDRFLIDKALKANGVENKICFLGDGQALVDHLNENLNSASVNDISHLPSLIILDINMPRMDGRAALKIVKNHPALKGIPVVMLSNSCNQDDVVVCYENGANSFFTKPMDYLELVRLMGLLKNYWFQTAELPFKPQELGG